MKQVIIAMLVALCSLLSFSQESATGSTQGPENGSLVIVGGGSIQGEIITRFAELAGGFDAPIVIIPTAAGGEPDSLQQLERWRNYGFKQVSVLHTRDPKIANTESFIAPLKEARGIWFGGGRQWRLVDSYGGTKAYIEFHNVLKRGGVIGGSSAGATIQGSFLARGAEKKNTIMIAPEENHREGFAFLTQCAIDQHIDKRDRWEDVQEIILEYPELLGIGISESTAMVVNGDIFEVIGAGSVAITEYKNLKDKDKNNNYLIINPGEKYNINTRKIHIK